MPHSPPLQINSPLRILVLSPPSTPLPPLLKDPTLPITTPYYSAAIPVWHDDVPTDLPQWEEEWRSEEAEEVVRAVGAWVVVFRKVVVGDVSAGKEGDVTLPQLRAFLNTVSTLLTHHTSISNSSYSFAPEPLLLAVGVHQPLNPRPELSNEEWEDLCRECGGWEWIDAELNEGGRGERNEFGEKTGLPRLFEALEANEWTNDNDDDAGSTPELDSILAYASDGDFAAGTAGLDAESLSGFQVALIDKSVPAGSGADDGRERSDEGEGRGEGEGEADVQVEELEKMMLKMQAAREKTTTMPPAQRPKFAASAVRDVLRRM